MQRQLRIQGGYRSYDEISFLKGFSILTIILSHLFNEFLTQVPEIIRVGALFGGTGVHVFFFCSGFGLYLSYLRHKTGYMEFLRKRFRKIYFPYIIVIAIIFFITAFPCTGNRVIALLSHTFLFKMFSVTYDESFGPYWYISTLFQLYFVFIPLSKLKEKTGRRLFLLICFAASIGWWIFTGVTGYFDIRPVGSFFLQYLWEFALGMVIADHMHHGGSLKLDSVLLAVTAIIGMSLSGILVLSADSYKALNDLPAMLGYSSLALLFYRLDPIRKAGLWLGKISYELYLIHYLIFKILYQIVHPESLFLQVMVGGLGIAITLLLSFFYHNIIHHMRLCTDATQS